jgi:hypothetical protein
VGCKIGTPGLDDLPTGNGAVFPLLRGPKEDASEITDTGRFLPVLTGVGDGHAGATVLSSSLRGEI